MKSVKSLLALVLGAIIMLTSSASAYDVELVSPVNGEGCVSKWTDFEWSVTGGIPLKYHFQASETATFDSIVVEKLDLDTASKVLTHVMLDKNNYRYYWRMICEFAGGDIDTSQVWNFTTVVAPTNNLTPVDEETCVSLQPEFRWAEMLDADEYTLQLSADSTFTNVIATINNIDTNAYSLPIPENFRTYWWRVQTTLLNGCITDWSPITEFKTNIAVPTLDKPVGNAVGLGFEVVCNWTSFEDLFVFANSFDVQVASGTDFDSTLVYDVNTVDHQDTFQFTENNKEFFWRVRGNYDECTTEWSQVRSFKIEYEKPSLIYPEVDQECVVMADNYQWAQVGGAKAYQVQIALDSEFQNMVVDTPNVASSSITLEIANSRVEHFWRVRAKDDENFSQWTDARRFVSSIYAPELFTPANGSVSLPLENTLTWEDELDNSVYAIEIATDIDFEDIIKEDIGLVESEYTFVFPNFNKTYYWRVMATNAGCVSDWSEVFELTTKIAPPVIIFPAHEETNVNLIPNFKWEKVDNADTYEVHFAEDADFTVNLKGKKGIDADNVSFFDQLDTHKVYFWKIRAKNDDGYSNWTSPNKFTTGGFGPETVQLESPLNDAVKEDIENTLVWKESERANMYHLQFARNNSFQDPIIDIDTLKVTSFQVPTMENYRDYYWRVAAINDSGKTKWSDTWKFRTIAAELEGTVTLDSPDNNEQDVSLSVYLRWNEFNDASGYKVQVATDENFTDLVVDADPVWKEQLLVDLESTKQYYWRVAAWNEANTTDWSETWTFKTKFDNSVISSDGAVFASEIMPNPISESAKISFVLPESGRVNIRLISATGELIEVIADKDMNNGKHTIDWSPNQLNNGVYFILISANGKEEVKQIVFTK